MDYRNFSTKKEVAQGTHPIWRGIGCLLMLVIPVISFTGGDLLLRYIRANLAGFAVPVELRGDYFIPGYGLVQDILAVLVLGFMLALVLFGLLAIFNAIIYGMTANTKASLNAPPQRPSKKRRLR